jgi:glycerol-3-phosphate dehydrogenase subunit C
MFDAARDHGRSNVEMLLPFAESGIPILGSSTSCTLELKREYQTVLGLSGSAVETIAGAVFDVFEFIRWELSDPFEEIKLSPVPAQVLYHPPCQLKNHGIGLPAEWALRRVPELSLLRSESECCGSAGTYGSKQERYAVARDVGAGLFQQASDEGAEFVLCDSETCRWWIQSHTGLSSIHPLEIIAAAMGLHELPEPGSAP